MILILTHIHNAEFVQEFSISLTWYVVQNRCSTQSIPVLFAILVRKLCNIATM